MEKQLATVQHEEPSVALMLQTFIEKGITTESVGAFSQLCELKERIDAKNNERAFNRAFHAFQSEKPEIVAQSIIPNRGKYERFEDVMHVIEPLLIKNGLSVSFTQSADEKRITVTCHLRHVDGHSVSTPFAVRLGGKADSDTQQDCKASTTAKRNALLQALNIVIRQDYLQEESPSNEGGYVTQAQADTLRDLVEQTGSDKAKFLAYADAKTFEEVYAERFEQLEKTLVAKLRK